MMVARREGEGDGTGESKGHLSARAETIGRRQQCFLRARWRFLARTHCHIGTRHLLSSAATLRPAFLEPRARLRLAMHSPAAPHPATTNFHLAIPYILPPSLAAFHATRARLLYPSHPLFSGTHCIHCGFPLTADNSQTRSVRHKRRKSERGDAATIRALRRSCRGCGHNEDVPLGAACPPDLPKVRDRVRCKPSTHHRPHASNLATPSSAESSSLEPISAQPRLSQQMVSSSTPASSRPSSVTGPFSVSPTPSSSTVSRTQRQDVSSVQDTAKARARQKKKSGLQNMLAKNRERQEQEKRKGGRQSAGLSAFLQGL